MNVILSIKPNYADAILSGEKRVEFRKTLFKKEVDKVFIYSSSPIKRVTGYFTITEIVRNSPQNLWEQFGAVGCINEEDFFKYFENKEIGFSICIDKVNRFASGIDPYKEIKNFMPPQSFFYYDGIISHEQQ